MTGHGAREGIWAVIPVKAFVLAKQRLAPAHSPSVRIGLARAMLGDVLAAATAAPEIAGVVVVTGDTQACRIARVFGARVHSEAADLGLTAAITAVARWLAAQGAAGMLVLPGDIPGITAPDISCLMARHGVGAAVTLSPSHDGTGTNALLATPADAIAFAWGTGSLAAHVAAARLAGIEPAVLEVEAIAHDLDTPDDVDAFLRRGTASRALDYLQSTRLPQLDPVAERS